MSEQINNKMRIFKKVFFVLLIADIIGFIVAIAAFVPMFKTIDEYGQIMLIVMSVLIALTAVVILFEIAGKIFLIRSSGRKGHTVVAILLLIFNLGSVIMSLLSAGGEGATIINQTYLYLQMLASATEVVTVVLYLRTTGKVLNGTKEDN